MNRVAEQTRGIWPAFLAFARLPAYWLILLAVTALCAFMRPFAAIPDANFAFAFIYWGLIVFTSGPLGTLIITSFQARGWPGAVQACIICLGFGAAVFLLVLGLSLALLPSGHFPNLWILFFNSAPTACFILGVMVFLMKRAGWFDGQVPSAAPPNPSPQATAHRPALLARLPELAHAKTIWALSAQDHYVRVLTDAGAGLCLIRLSDAIRECGGIAGIQIHRSHWVALAAIANTATYAKDGQIKLPTGETLPISKSRLRDLKQFADELGQRENRFA